MLNFMKTRLPVVMVFAIMTGMIAPGCIYPYGAETDALLKSAGQSGCRGCGLIEGEIEEGESEEGEIVEDEGGGERNEGESAEGETAGEENEGEAPQEGEYEVS